MIYPPLLFDELNTFLRFKVTFNEAHQSYLFNDKWALEIEDEYFDQASEKLKNILLEQLRTGNNNLLLLEDVLNIIDDKIEWLKIKQSRSFDFFSKYKVLKDYTDANNPPIDVIHKGSIEKFVNDSDHDNCDHYLFHMWMYSQNTNSFKEDLDFEKAKILFIVLQFEQAISEFGNFVFQLKENYNYIDFSKISTEMDSISNNDNLSNVLKCHSTYSKSNLGQLFYFLMDEKILFFDDVDPKNNRKLMQDFVCQNFTYKGDGNRQTSIDNINKQFSESIGFTYSGKQLQFLDNLIQTLQRRRDKIKPRD